MRKGLLMFRSVNFLVLGVFTLILSAKAASPDAGPGDNRNGVTLHLVTYNVENFFDTNHDADQTLPNGKEDYTFLPLNHPLKKLCEKMNPGFYKTECEQTNWTTDHFNWKLSNISRSISFLKNKPDILSLAEVENENVVGAIAKKMGYGNSFSVTTSPDHRGIDVGLIYNKAKLDLKKVIQIKVEGDGLVKPTRNILRAEFKIKNAKGKLNQAESLFVYVNHWPSQAAPAKTRMLTAKILKNDIESVSASFEGTPYFVAMGDFNTIPSDAPHPFNDLLTNKNSWANAMVDGESFSREKIPSLNHALLPGSYWFDREQNWNKLDHIFVSQNLVDGKEADIIPASFFIANDSRVMNESVPHTGPFAGQNIMVPQRFDTLADNERKMGFSDHLPVGIDLNIPAAN